MKKKRVTYGVTGMMEYQAVIKMGRSQMKVLFTDGSATGYGMNPAMYTTDNLMVQEAIENSEQYKRGRIHIVSSTELEEEVQIVRSEESSASEESGERSEESGASPDEPETAPETESEPETETAPETEPEHQAAVEMEFDNNDDAKDYLEQTYGCQRSKLRNRADIIAAGESNGVKISFS